MSLRRLMRNYMTIQTSEGNYQQLDTDGAIDRHSSWVTLNQFKNIKCHIQEKSRETVTDKYMRHEEEHRDIIYHTSLELYNYAPNFQQNQTSLRILVARNYGLISSPISDLTDNDIYIFEFMGHIEQVKAVRKRFNFFVLRCQKTDRWSL